MGDFSYTIVKPKKDIEKLCKALDEFALYVKATLPFDPTGLTDYNRYKSENDIVWLSPIRKFKEVNHFQRYLEDFKNGKEILCWFGIRWLHKNPLHLIAKIREFLKKHDCEWFWNELTQTGDSIANSAFSQLEDLLFAKQTETENMTFEKFLKQFRNNKILLEKQDTKITVLTYWENPLVCESCGKKTYMTSRTKDFGFPHPLCEDCYKKIHAFHVAVITSKKEKKE